MEQVYVLPPDLLPPQTCSVKVKKVDFEEVSTNGQYGQPSKFNSSFHEVDDSPLQFGSLPARPSEAPYSLSRWLPLILRTRNLEPDTIQTVKLSGSQARLLLKASTTSILRGDLDRTLKEDLMEEILPAFSSLRYPKEGLFMRLDACSPKDGNQRTPGNLSLHDGEDILLRLATSQRARNNIQKSLNMSSSSIPITFFPFNESMVAAHEYRIYCSPGSGTITAISQYRWWKPWAFAQISVEDQNVHLQNIWLGASQIHQQILDDLDKNNELDRQLLDQGFSFDLFYNTHENRSELVELNVFGATSGCGSCLFHWETDFNVLYGDGTEVEFRVTW